MARGLLLLFSILTAVGGRTTADETYPLNRRYTIAATFPAAAPSLSGKITARSSRTARSVSRKTGTTVSPSDYPAEPPA